MARRGSNNHRKGRWPKRNNRRVQPSAAAKIDQDRREGRKEEQRRAELSTPEHLRPGYQPREGTTPDEWKSAEDAAMVKEAINKRWGTRPEVRDKIMEQFGAIATGIIPGVSLPQPGDKPPVRTPDEVATPYQRIAAARLYMTAERMNQVDEIGESPTELNINVRSVEPDDRRAAVLGAIAAEARRRRALAAGGLGGTGGGGLDGDMLDTIDGSVDRVDHDRTRRPGEGDRDP